MKEKILMKDQVSKLYDELSKGFDFYAPVKEDGNVSFEKIDEFNKIDLDYSNSKVPPKSVLFPKIETLFEYSIDGKKIEIQNDEKTLPKNIIFGLRSCDAHSFNLLDNFFQVGKYQDNIFSQKRNNSILVGMGCNHPRKTCFCTSLNGHPFKKDDYDVFLVDLNGKYLVDPITEKGRELVEKLSWLTDATDADLEKSFKLLNVAELAISSNIDLDDTSDILKDNYNNPLWDELSKNCIGCGTCSYLCPTCHCFDVVDENDHYNNKGRRIRIWDTCQFCIFTQETSGHNPRATGKERLRQRILHKFSFYPINYETIGCVGCGRCVQYCPVNNDIRTILKVINEIKNKEEENIIA